jgi:transposase InsO family protein
LGRVRALEPKPPAVRYERRAARALLRIDSKKLGRIAGLGHRITCERRQLVRKLGWEYQHVAIDDATRLSYTELLPDESGPSCASFLARAVAWFAGIGVRNRVGHDRQRFRLHPCTRVPGHPRRARPRHLTTQPYCPRTNGKAERFIQTALREWLYGRPYTNSTKRATGMPAWPHWYNHHRSHAGITPLLPPAG